MSQKRVSFWLSAVAGALASLGCAASAVRSLHAGEYDCPEEKVLVEEKDYGHFVASGCGQTSEYRCEGTLCNEEEPEEDEPEVLLVVPVVAAEPEQSAPALQEVASRKEAGGVTKVALDLQLDETTTLRFRAAPEKHGELVQVKVLSKRNIKDCEIQWMLNRQRIQAPSAHSRYIEKTGEYEVLANLPHDLVRELATAQQFALRACDQRWAIFPEQLNQVRHFVALYEEELAWNGSMAASSGGLMAPSGGWPKWTMDGSPPAAVSGAPKTAEQLFEQLSRSVMQIEALGSSGSAQGSAVAVSKTEMLTNCHVVQGARKIIAKHGDREWVASVVRSQPAGDRCVLAIAEPALNPVIGVRPYSDVRVGEKVFTLGAPSGLELTLSDGIVSGLREQEGLQLIQATAPISPGSSGGGLFDARGNVIGVTTAILIGKERLNQALNFAIPAEAFWKP